MAVSLVSADQFLSFGLSLASMQLNKKAFVKDPRFLLGIRISFVVSILLQVLIALYMRRRIIKTNDQRKVKTKAPQSLFGAQEGTEEEVEISFFEYDLNEVNKILRSSILQGLIVGFIHYKWGVPHPLLMQSSALIRNLLFSCLYRAHLYGMDVLRPFELNMLFQKLQPAVEEIPAEKKKKKEE